MPKCHVPGTKLFKNKEMINFSGIDKHQDVAGSVHKNLFQMKQYGSVENPLSMLRTGSSKTAHI